MYSGITKYQLGDTVRIRGDLTVGIRYLGIGVNSSMVGYANRLAIITKIFPLSSHNGYGYHIDLDGKHWNWTDDMLIPKEPLVSEEERARMISLSDNLLSLIE